MTRKSVVVREIRLTMPVREALIAAGNSAVPLGGDNNGWDVVLTRPPPGLVVCRRQTGELALRLENEPEWPGEMPPETVGWAERGDWVPCPSCGSALTWDEAGRVPGARRCLKGHQCVLTHDGSGVKPQDGEC